MAKERSNHDSYMGSGLDTFCKVVAKTFLSVAYISIETAHISGHPFIAPTARIYAPWLLTVGDRSCIATRSEIYNLGPVIIKERVTIAQYAYICNGSHDLSDNKLPLVVGDVVIDNDVFIGARAIILPGLHLCRYSVVGAGAVLTKNTTDFGIYAGNPARFIKERNIYGE